jgi:hypothetical protein
LWADEVDEVTAGTLVLSYVKRERWKARLQAAEIAMMLAGKPVEPKRVTPDELMAMAR